MLVTQVAEQMKLPGLIVEIFGSRAGKSSCWRKAQVRKRASFINDAAGGKNSFKDTCGFSFLEYNKC